MAYREMTIDVFEKEAHRRVERFFAEYRCRSEATPEEWPTKMGVAEWWEQFEAFDTYTGFDAWENFP